MVEMPNFILYIYIYIYIYIATISKPTKKGLMEIMRLFKGLLVYVGLLVGDATLDRSVNEMSDESFSVSY